MLDIPRVLADLATRRPIFHSEADFQHALAWEIHRLLPNASVRLELPVAHMNKLLHVDVWVVQGDAVLAIELKYKTRAFSMSSNGEQFILRNQSAQDLGRYDFIKDIQRLERIASARTNVVGYTIMLTNDSAYWASREGYSPLDAEFRLYEGRTLHGLMNWGSGASAGTKRN